MLRVQYKEALGETFLQVLSCYSPRHLPRKTVLTSAKKFPKFGLLKDCLSKRSRQFTSSSSFLVGILTQSHSENRRTLRQLKRTRTKLCCLRVSCAKRRQCIRSLGHEEKTHAFQWSVPCKYFIAFDKEE